MIIKYFNLKSNSLKQNKILLFYGNNEGLKNETISKIINCLKKQEKEVLWKVMNTVKKNTNHSSF